MSTINPIPGSTSQPPAQRENTAAQRWLAQREEREQLARRRGEQPQPSGIRKAIRRIIPIR